MEQNVRLNDLMFKALDHAVDSVRSGGDLVPFVMTEADLHRFVTTTLQESKARAEDYLRSLSEPLAVLAYDGYLTLEGNKYEAVFVKAFDRTQDTGILLAQRYKPKKFLSKFTPIGNPAVVEHPPNPWK